MKLSKILKNRNVEIIILDLFMLGLLMINLGLILFDWLFITETLQNLLSRYTPDFYFFYESHIHRNFLIIDLGFVTIFLLEFSLRWFLAARRHIYHRWFFYPFIHWYDLLGCVPVLSFRFLRVLRVVSIIIRLHKLQIIDLTKTYLFEKGVKYYNILVEEISDRVVVNIIEGVQEEIRQGTPVTNRVLREVISPQKDFLVEWIARRVQKVSADAHHAYHDEIKEYVERRIGEAVDKNREINTISQIPVFGSIIADNLEKAISDIVFNVINGAIEDLASANNKGVIADFTDITLETLLSVEEDLQLDQITKNIFLQSLELIKGQVKVKQWKVKEMAEQEARARERLQAAWEE